MIRELVLLYVVLFAVSGAAALGWLVVWSGVAGYWPSMILYVKGWVRV